jgi:hypothetical protein
VATSIASVSVGRPMGSRVTGIDDRHVHLGVVDLHDRQRRGSLQCSRRGQEHRLGLPLAFAPPEQFGRVVTSEPAAQTTNGGNRQSLAPAIGGHLGPESRHGGTPPRRVEVAEMPLDDREELGRQRPHAGMRASTAWQQRTGASAVSKQLQPAKQRRPADPKSGHGVA